MNILLLFCACFFLLGGTSNAQDPEILDKYQWNNRLLLVYAASNESPVYQEQVQEFEQHQKGVEERDLVIFFIFPQKVINPEGKVSPSQTADYLRQRYSIASDQFAVILIGKDGGAKLTEKEFLSTDRLFGTIDQMPMRQREMRSN